MRSKLLLILLTILFTLLTLVGNFHQRDLTGFPDDNKLLNILQERSPATFWKKLGELTARTDIDAALACSTLRRFDELNPTLNIDDRVSIDAARAALFVELKYYTQAVVLLRHVTTTSRSAVETKQCLTLLADIHTATSNKSELQLVNEELQKISQPLQPLNQQVQPENIAVPQKTNLTVFFLALWIFLMLFPAAVTSIEKHVWLNRYACRADRRGPFVAFLYSPMCNILLTASAIMLLLLSLPYRLGSVSRFIFLAAHILISWSFCQIPLHSIESLVKKNSSGLLRYCREQLSLAIARHLPLIAGALTLIILHNMVVRLPIWPITRPLGAAAAPVVFFAAILLLFQFSLPWLLFLKKWPAQTSERSDTALQQRIFITNDGFRQGIVETGSLSITATSVIFGGLQNHLADENLQLLLERSQHKFSSQTALNDFLLTMCFVTGISILPALNPIFWIRLFGSGPNFIQALALLSSVAFCGIIRRALERKQQKEIDAGFASEGRSDQLLNSLEIINKLNFFPDNMREGERSEFDPLTLNESRINLHAASGKYLPATSRPDSLVLISLWRGRLAIDWKLGREESVFLTSLDYQVNATDAESELCALAARHNRLGAECIYLTKGQQLKIVFCSQKFSAFTSETPLPQDKICQICSEAMFKASQFGPYKWESTPEGCGLAIDAEKL
ncbi:MAG: hypothetical protein KKB51_12805 [Candidatus Riflebacteria bacterium]|nr:hypothetical protein [Candidatus Riflebacteria bacterium]